MGNEQRMNAAAMERMKKAQEKAERLRYDAAITRIMPKVIEPPAPYLDDKSEQAAPNPREGEVISTAQQLEVPRVKMPGVNQHGYWIFEGEEKILLIPTQQIVDVELTKVEPEPAKLIEVPKLVGS